jgi:hypothetical protein
MKIYLIAFVLTSCALPAAEAPLPAFTGKIGAVPPLSLTESLKAGPLPFLGEYVRPSAARSRLASRSGKKYFSNMPVLVPPAEAGSKMPVVAPDASIDFKMLVVEPGVETAN